VRRPRADRAAVLMPQVQDGVDRLEPAIDGVPRPSAAGRAGRSRVRRYAGTVAVALAILALLRAFLVQSFVIPSGSMEPALRVGERVLVFPSAYRFGRPRRGDVVVFDGAGIFDSFADQPSNDLVGLARSLLHAIGVPVAGHTYAKRIIGLPGERVACCDARHRLTIDGQPLTEPWVVGQPPSTVHFDVIVPDGHYWMLGDNRNKSADSRTHLGDPGGGMVPQDRIVGKVVAVYWPASRLRAVLDGEGST